jgi:hypothetical protein
LYWNSSISGYTAYSSSGTAGTSGKFYSGTSFVTAADQRLNYTGGLYVNSLTNNAIYGRNDYGYAVYGYSSGGTAGFFYGDTYRAISAYSSTGQLAYLQKGGSLTSNDSASVLYITRSNTINSYNTTGHIIEILDYPTIGGGGYVSGSTLKATIDTTQRIDMNPRVANIGTNVAYILDTHNNLTTGRKLLSIRNQGVEKFSIDVAGGFLAASSISVGNDTTDYTRMGTNWLEIAVSSSQKLALNPSVTDGASATAYYLGTTNTLSTQGAKLLSVLNNGTPRFYVDWSGNTFTSGVTISANTRRIAKVTLTSGTTTTWDMNLSSNAEVTISGSTTLSITNLVNGDSGTLVIIQSAPSGTLTYPSGSRYSGGVPYVLTGSGGVDILTFYYDGTNYYWNIGLSYS